MMTGVRSSEHHAHRRALLARGRCPECAELIRGTPALFGHEACSHCGYCSGDEFSQEPIPLPPWRQRRWALYVGVGVASFFVSWLPLVGTLLVIAAMMVARWYVLAESLRWLSPARRVCSRFSIRVGIGLLGASTLILQEALTLLPMIGWAAKPLAGVGVLVLFVEVGGRYVEGRALRDARSASLDTWEWAVPTAMLGGVMSIAVAGVVFLTWVWEQVSTLPDWLVL